MKRAALFASLLLGIPTAGGLVIAQTAAPSAKPAAPAAAPVAHEHDHAAAAPGQPGAPHQETDMMCGKMMGGGMGSMMGGGTGSMMGGGMGPLMGPTTKIAVKNVEKGVTMTFTSDDAAAVSRLRKMAEGMRLMHEATATDH